MPVLKRIPYFPEQAQKFLARYDAFVMVGTNEPTAFFGYAEGVTSFLPEKAPRVRIDTEKQDAGLVLEALSSVLGPDVGQNELRSGAGSVLALPALPCRPASMPRKCARRLPPSSRRAALWSKKACPRARFITTYSPYLKPYSHLTLTGGAIGMGMPLALGAALAAPDRQVIDIQADGSAMYTLQALWSQAREKTKVITVICSNRKYFTIELECLRAGYKSLGE